MKLKNLACLSLIALVASVSPAAHGQTYKIIREFVVSSGGTNPTAGLTIRGGTLWGTTSNGGSLGLNGTVYDLVYSGNKWVGGDLFDFPGGAGNPGSKLIFSSEGRPYGTTMGNGDSDLGTVFYMVPQPTICKVVTCQAWRENLLYQFKGFPDGAHPGYGDLLLDRQGNIYGTTTIGGAKEFGVVYQMMPPMPPSKTWTESVIWSFAGPDGEYPQNAVLFDGNGNLLGTAKQGGLSGFGTVFKLTPSGKTWTETNVYDFRGGGDGRYPIAGLMLDSSGNLYGATSDGGSGGGGTVFELIPSGNTYSFRVLYSFSGQQGKNCGPWATLTMDAAGSLYGTTYCNGANSFGSVFKLTNNGNTWAYTPLHNFPAFSGDGFWPISDVTFDSMGNLYGTTFGGTNNGGVVWEIMP